MNGAHNENTQLKRGASRARVTLLIMGVVSAAGAIISMLLLYSAANEQYRAQVQALAKSQAALIDAVARFDQIESQDANPAGAWVATLGQVAAGHAGWHSLDTGVSLLIIGNQGDQTVMHVQDGVLLAPHSKPLTNNFAPVFAENPLRRGSGSGTNTAEYHTVDGTSWFEVREPIPALDMAVLARLNLDTVDRPLRHALQVSTGASVLLVALGIFLARKTSVRNVEELGRELLGRKRAEEQLSRHQLDLEATIRDRTAQLERAHAELLASARFATLGQVTAKVSHELRNPLGTIRASLHTLRLRTGEQVDGAGKIFDRLERNVLRCDRIIEELLTYTRPRHAKREWLDLGELISVLLGDYKPAQAVAIACNTQPLIRVFADPEDMRRILTNLLNNAVDASTPGGSAVQLSATQNGAEIVVRVADRGAGMSGEVLGKAFEPLFSTKGFGVGLGLPIVRELVERNGGRIELFSEQGSGTEAVLHFSAESERG